MARTLWIAVWALAACAPEIDGDTSDMLDGVAMDRLGPPLPTTMALQITDPLSPGWPVQIQVTGAVPNHAITLVRSTGTIGVGGCLAVLGGNCLGITPGAGYRTLPMMADAQGRATLALTVPTTIAYGSNLVFQAVDQTARSGSNTLARQVAFPACADDLLEDNDTIATATSAGAAPIRARSCAGDDDIYRYTLQPGEEITIAADFHHALDGDIEMILRDGVTGDQIDASRSSNDQEVVSWGNFRYGPAVIDAQIYMYTDSFSGAPADFGAPSGVEYTLTATRVQLGTCPPDANEPDDVAADATGITSGTVNGLTACQADEWDWFKIVLPAGAKLTVTAMHQVADGDVDIYLLDAPGPSDLRTLNQNNLARAFSTQDDDFLYYDIGRGGTYWIAVHLYEDRPGAVAYGNTYALDVDVQ